MELRNPGMSLWVFVALAETFHARDPIGLARAVQWSSIVAIVLVVLFASRTMSAAEREVLAALGLGAVRLRPRVLARKRLRGVPLVPARRRTPDPRVLGLHVGLGAVALWILGRSAGRAWRRRGEQRRPRLHDSTALAIGAAMWGFGILLTLCGVRIHRHYLLVSFPLEFLWLARMALPPAPCPRDVQRQGRAALAALVVLELALSASFLGYLHVNGGAPRGDYGIAYGAQRPEADPSAP